MKITRLDMKNCLTREIGMRRRVYRNRVAEGRMTKAEADKEIDTMSAVLRLVEAARQEDVETAGSDPRAKQGTLI